MLERASRRKLEQLRARPMRNARVDFVRLEMAYVAIWRVIRRAALAFKTRPDPPAELAAMSQEERIPTMNARWSSRPIAAAPALAAQFIRRIDLPAKRILGDSLGAFAEESLVDFTSGVLCRDATALSPNTSALAIQFRTFRRLSAVVQKIRARD
jgi:hypothetical protein